MTGRVKRVFKRFRATQCLRLFPNQYINPEIDFSNSTLEEWTSEFEYEEDMLGGAFDWCSWPENVWEEKHGDCEDFAVAVASYLLSETDKDVSYLFVFNGYSPIPTHMAVWDGDSVYSSGSIHSEGLEYYKSIRDENRFRLIELSGENVSDMRFPPLTKLL